MSTSEREPAPPHTILVGDEPWSEREVSGAAQLGTKANTASLNVAKRP